MNLAELSTPEPQQHTQSVNQSHFDPPLLTAFEMSDFCGDAFYTVRPDGVITSANKTCELIFGVPPEEMVGKNIETLCRQRYSHRQLSIGLLHTKYRE